jgi:hypothetical protein
MAMTRTRNRMQSTLTFLSEQLVSVDKEMADLRSKEPREEAGAERLRSLEAKKLALVVAIRQFDPELDLGAIGGAGADGGGHG